ncbi:MAG: ABC transporter ATP-binding protein/permease [Rickettsiales bacterium]|jgi:ATP-binding cassette subfamily B protein|nr:ABC transporter ATP-binding protein/permease [Rickettsiales bacterium]
MKTQKKPKNIWKTIIRICGYTKDMKLLMTIMLVLCIIGAIGRTIGNLYLQQIIDNYITPLTNNYTNELFASFVNIILIVLGLFIIGAIATLIVWQISAFVSNEMLEGKLKPDLFKKMESLPLNYFDTNKNGDIMSLYTNDMRSISGLLYTGFITLITSTTITIINFSMMLYLSWQLTIIIVLTLFVMIIKTKQFAKGSKLYFKKQQIETGKLNGFVEEMVQGQKVVKVFNREKQSKIDFDHINNKLCDSSTKANSYVNLLMPTLNNVSNINYAIIIIVGSTLVFKDILTLGVAVAFFQFSKAFIYPISELTQIFKEIMSALAGAERIFAVFDLKEEINGGTREVKELKGNVELKNVVFKYNNEKIILNNINLKVDAGTKIALVGSTGAGKTTITSLLNRFYDVSEGSILFDGIDIREFKLKSLRKNISVVLQDTHLFTGTVMENIKYGRRKATDEEAIMASKLANADDFIQHLPEKYNTILTGDATNLSQGERQLLNITRALLVKTPLLILDEATSSIDTRTEKLIEEGMNNLMKGKTTFIIAHRLSTVRNSNIIVVLEHGKIIEHGNHQELLDRKGRYYQLYTGMSELE